MMKMNGASWPSANRLMLGLIGNPENRRIRDFRKAMEQLGFPKPPCIAYIDLLRDPSAFAKTDVDAMRVDSPGENATLTSALIALGGGPEKPNLSYGEIRYMQEYYRGYCSILDRIHNLGIPCLNPPADVRVMFDKWASHQRFVACGLARPPARLAPPDWPAFRELIRTAPRGRIFLKPLYGSSASGVCAFRWTRHAQQLIAPIRIQEAEGRVILLNCLSVRTYTTVADIEQILGILLPQGMLLEEWVPKLTLPGGAMDLRVLVISGKARHWVVRQSRHPMTNLHLGNRRGDPDCLRSCIGEDNIEAAFRLAEKAAACFPDSLYAGVDVLIDSSHRALIGEINAFGDLLPGLFHGGESAYEAIINAFLHHFGCPV
jgi:hypothetical protein